jgi:D-amino peptidase
VKVLISVDMEGVTGVTHPDDTLAHGADYAMYRRFMTRDADAAVKGAFDAGATEVIVNDSHMTMRNLLLEDLDPRARVIKGFNKPLCMVQGIDDTVDALVCIGYHSCSGAEGGVLNHTLLGKEVQNLLFDGEPIGETRLNALIAGQFGVPIAFVSGDDTVCHEARGVLGDDLPAYAVKDGIDMLTASCLHPEVTYEGIRTGVSDALRDLADRGPHTVTGEHRFTFEWNSTSIAETCAYIPTVRKTAPRVSEFATSDMTEAMKVIVAQLLLAMQVGNVEFYS